MDLDFEEEQKWRKPNVDFHTLAITTTADHGTFTKQNCLVPPIFTSSVFQSSKSAAVEEDGSVRRILKHLLNI
jgi:hypothetical protein